MPRLAADAFKPLTALADDHALVRLALDHDGGADAAEVALFLVFVDDHGGRVGQFFTRQAKQLFAHEFAGQETVTAIGECVCLMQPGLLRRGSPPLLSYVLHRYDWSESSLIVELFTRAQGRLVVVAKGAGCCGALTHHMGKEALAHGSAAANIRAWMVEKRQHGLDAIVINTSGCGTTIKDYGHMFRTDPVLAADAGVVAGLAKDVSEVLVTLGLPEGAAKGLRIAYHAACSLQHGQQIKTAPKDLLKRVGFEVVEPADSHLCCGSAGTYNLLQPKISQELQARKVAALEAKAPDVISAGNIGCMMQIGAATGIPVVHTVELLDWATGGPRPKALDA